MSEIELKACPFCGGTAFMAQEGTHATCLTPGCCVGPVSGVDRWNTRAPQWQPIETAPKDGTAILACYAPHYETNGFLPVAVRWRAYHPNARGNEEWRDSSGAKVRAITHWQPLPAPPEVEG